MMTDTDSTKQILKGLMSTPSHATPEETSLDPLLPTPSLQAIPSPEELLLHCLNPANRQGHTPGA